ncbi:hypothetical protein PYW07_010328 [Mythimna separata]|uniref:Peptidase S1 domain-containing protein n=1 Tax=Mythimna separata TaxID=271217 RepID=A0AAD7Y9Z8_MYTSE|nr:hypothetical protein PYW07_010328 [Mythimna separata]
MKGICLVFITLVIVFNGGVSAARCDVATTAQVQEGNLGQSGDFNWLGILHVHQYEEGKIRVAMTGIVLIKLKHALANADDVVKIPMKIFKSESKAMFMPARDTPWEVKPASYVTHPEYEYATLNTIAVIELDLDDVDDYPLNPICLPSGETFNTSRYLYLTGFTDENKKIEKVIYNIQYLEKQVCEEFYNRAGLSSQKRTPTVYVCGYAPSNKTQCVWDSGMVLVSNVTGYFNLIGFGVHGPGCAAPARFVDLFPYFSWINSIITPDEVYDEASFRRKDDHDEFSPEHEQIRMNDSLHKSDIIHHDFTQNPLVKGNIDLITKVAEDEKPTLPSNNSRIPSATVTS